MVLDHATDLMDSVQMDLLQAINTLCLLEVPVLWNKPVHTAETLFQSPVDYHVAPVTAWSYAKCFPSQESDSSAFNT